MYCSGAEGRGGVQFICKGTIENNLWLCDTGTWIECNEDNVNKIQEWDNYKYQCVQEDGEFKWIDISEETGEDSDLVSIFTGFINRVIIFVAGLRLF